jgi:hypothetical protein
MEKQQDELIKVGDDCETLLKSQPFTRVINALTEGSFQRFVNSKPEDKEERDHTYYHYRALVDVVNTLKQQIAVRDEIIAKSQEDDNSQEEQ